MTLRTPALLYGLALLLHGLWAVTITTPVDWDPLYYRSVAQHILAGEGAVTGALWSLGWLPAQLPFPADLHWMPLPSRVLLPGLALWPAHGDQLVTALIAACWAPLAWALARRLGAPPNIALLGGLMAAGAGAYARFLSTPDSLALYGALGSLALLLLGRRTGSLLLTVAALCLTRGDGFLLAGALALGLGRSQWRLALGVLGVALGVNALWLARCQWLAAPGPLLLREQSANALTYSDFLLGTAAAPDITARVTFAGGALPESLGVMAMSGLYLLILPALFTLWQHRARAWVRAAAAYALLLPVGALVLAPAVAASGTVFRSGAALFPATCALAALAVGKLSELAHQRRGYPRAFLPVLFGAAFLIGSMGMGILNCQARPAVAADCRALQSLPQGQAVFAADALRVEALCGRAAVSLHAGLTPERAKALAARYGVRAAWPGDPQLHVSNATLSPEEMARLLPDWTLSDGGVLLAPTQ